MNKRGYCMFFVFIVLINIITIFLFFYKFENVTKAIVIKNENNQYLYLESKNYNELKNKKKIIVQSGNAKYECNVISYEVDSYGYYLVVDNLNINENFKEVVIILNSKNLFGF